MLDRKKLILSIRCYIFQETDLVPLQQNFQSQHFCVSFNLIGNSSNQTNPTVGIYGFQDLYMKIRRLIETKSLRREF